MIAGRIPRCEFFWRINCWRFAQETFESMRCAGPKQFATLWPATAGRRLRKTRYEIPWKNLKIEIDIYHGRNHGLMVAEVEFPSQASCRQFKSPRWFGREITGEKRYSNVRLARE